MKILSLLLKGRKTPFEGCKYKAVLEENEGIFDQIHISKGQHWEQCYENT